MISEPWFFAITLVEWFLELSVERPLGDGISPAGQKKEI